MNNTIFRHEVIAQMDTGDPFDLVFITCDRRRGTGGKIRRVTDWCKIKGDEPVENLPGEFWRKGAGPSRNPSHLENRTSNIYNPNNPGEHAVKVHWDLMQFFNGKRILQ